MYFLPVKIYIPVFICIPSNDRWIPIYPIVKFPEKKKCFLSKNQTGNKLRERQKRIERKNKITLIFPSLHLYGPCPPPLLSHWLRAMHFKLLYNANWLNTFNLITSKISPLNSGNTCNRKQEKHTWFASSGILIVWKLRREKKRERKK